MKRFFSGFNKYDLYLWSVSVTCIAAAFFLYRNTDHLKLAVSIIGVTSLIFNAKGNPFGQLLMVVFSVIYGYISYSFRYYGEMITYIGMTLPMALFSLISWLRHPFQGAHSEVEVNRLSKKEYAFMGLVSIIVTVLFFFILKALDTSSLIFSTLSVLTSFTAAYFTFRRTKEYALAYALNDIVLIILWSIASDENKEYISLIICFIMFLANDIYGYISWSIMEKRQKKIKNSNSEKI